MAKMAMGVQLVDGRTGPADLVWLYQTVEQLTRKAGLPMPEVGIYDSPEVNAFATGPSKRSSLVAVSSWLLRSMRREEIEVVLAHEVSHIQNGDMVTDVDQGVVNASDLLLAHHANIVRQPVDERISGLVFFVTTIVFDIVFSIPSRHDGRRLPRALAIPRTPARCERQHDRRPERLQANQGLVDQPSHSWRR
jgi:heat shock protein HtpX